MRLFHGTSALNASCILNEGFTLDFLATGVLGKGVYLSRDINKCANYGRHILQVEIEENSILQDTFSSISNYDPERNVSLDAKSKFKNYTLSKGYKGLELDSFNEVCIYDLSCIISTEHYAIK